MKINTKKLERLVELMQSRDDAGTTVGNRISIFLEGKQVFGESTGYADPDKGMRFDDDTIIRMYSMTKPITSAAAMILYERGMLDLLEPLYKYIPEYRDIRVYENGELVKPKRPIIIKDLLNMTCPISYPDANLNVGRKMEKLYNEIQENQDKGIYISTVELAKKLSGMPMEFHPGDRFMYGVGADILGAVIEIISGMTLGEFMSKEIFEPLVMNDTGFYITEEKAERLAKAYEDDGNGGLKEFDRRHLCVGKEYFKKPLFESGGAGLLSTINDYNKFAQMILGGGEYNGVRILGERTVKFMVTPALTEYQRRTFNWESLQGYSYGNLNRILVDAAQGVTNGSVGEYGWDGWFGTYYIASPKDKLVILYAVQRPLAPDTFAFYRLIRQVIYGALEE